jgi:hypothetical protein
MWCNAIIEGRVMESSRSANLASHYTPLPATLSEYASLHSVNLSDTTKSRFRTVWKRLLAKHSPVESLADKILLSIMSIKEKYEASEIEGSSYKHYRSALLFGLSELINAEGALYPEFENGIDDIDVYKYHYITLINLTLESLNQKKKITKENIAHEEGEVDDRVSILLGDLSEIHPESPRARVFPKKLDSFPKNIFEWICALESKKTNATRAKPSLMMLKLFLRANILLGLRLVEWQHIMFAYNFDSKKSSVPGDLVLVIPNSQHSKGLARGESRMIILKGITKSEKADVLKFKNAFDSDMEKTCLRFLKKDNAQCPIESYGEGMYASLVSKRFLALQNLLNETLDGCPFLDKNNMMRPKLSSVRDQCINNAKKAKVSAEEIAAFFGHSSTHTADSHYGSSGWGTFKFRPDPSSLLLVKADQTSKSSGKPANAIDWDNLPDSFFDEQW